MRLNEGTAQLSSPCWTAGLLFPQAQRCYTGLEIRDDVLWLNPRLPDKHLKSFAFSIRYRGRWLTIEVTHERLKVLFRGGWEKTAKIVCRGDESVLEPGDAAEFLL